MDGGWRSSYHNSGEEDVGEVADQHYLAQDFLLPYLLTIIVSASQLLLIPLDVELKSNPLLSKEQTGYGAEKNIGNARHAINRGFDNSIRLGSPVCSWLDVVDCKS